MDNPCPLRVRKKRKRNLAAKAEILVTGSHLNCLIKYGGKKYELYNKRRTAAFD